MKKVFKNRVIQDEFDSNGYVILDYFQKVDVDEILAMFYSNITDFDREPLYESSRNNSDVVNTMINDFLQQKFSKYANQYFEDVAVYGGTYMVKPAKSEDFLPLHQDWSIVEEDKHFTAFMWSPMQLTDTRNGGLFAVNGSHNFFNNRRSGSLPAPRISPEKRTMKHTNDLTINAGQVIIYSDKLFHGSYPNTTLDPRVVATGRIIEKGAKLTYYHRLEDGKIGVFCFKKEEYLNQIMKLVKGEIPEGQSPVYIEENNNIPVTDATFQKAIQKACPSIFGKILMKLGL
jgi:ectoine hydroxylase-related dioxygenase (phytanoyl-CoA dioxygenase family)